MVHGLTEQVKYVRGVQSESLALMGRQVSQQLFEMCHRVDVIG